MISQETVLFLLPVFVITKASNLALLLVIAVAPTVFLLWFFYHADRYKHESRKLLAVTFFIGALMIGPAIIIELVLRAFIPDGPGIISIFIYYVFGVAIVEESLKVLSVRVYAYKSPRFNEPMDGLILGVAAALGFATVENILYVLSSGLITGIVRALTSVPSHALFGAISGYYLGEAKFRKKWYLVFKGLIAAILLHAIFDTVATAVPNLIGVVALGAFTLVVYYRIVRGEIKEAEQESPFKPDKPVSATLVSYVSRVRSFLFD